MNYDFEFECECEEDLPLCYPTKSTRKGEQTPMNDFRNYLTRRMDNVYHEGKTSLAKTFYLLEDDAPQSAKAFAERIQAGKFQLPTLNPDTGLTAYGSGPYGIIFRDPAHVADTDGFTAAIKLLQVERQKTLDTINVLDEAAALTAFQAFQTYVTSLTPAPVPVKTPAAVAPEA